MLPYDKARHGFCPGEGAVLFLLDGAQVLKQSERAFLEQRILRRSRDKLLFVIGKADLLSTEEREETLRYCKQNLTPVLAGEPAIFLVSAKQALAGQGTQSGIPQLLVYLREYLSQQRGRVLLDNASADGQRLASYLRQNLGIKRRSLALSLEELEARIENLESILIEKDDQLDRRLGGRSGSPRPAALPIPRGAGAPAALPAKGDTVETIWEQPKFDFVNRPLDPIRLEAFFTQIQCFIDDLLDGRPATVSGEEGRAAVAIVEAAQKSARTGQAVELT